MGDNDGGNNLRDLFNIILKMRGGELEAPFELTGSARQLLKIKCKKCNTSFRLKYGGILYKKFWCMCDKNEENLTAQCERLYAAESRSIGTIQQIINGICSFIIHREIMIGDEPFTITKNGHTYAFVYKPETKDINEDIINPRTHIFTFDKEMIKRRMYNEFKRDLYNLIVEKHQLNVQTISPVDINSNISAFNFDLVRAIWNIPLEGLDSQFINAASSSNTVPIPPLSEHESSEELLQKEEEEAAEAAAAFARLQEEKALAASMAARVAPASARSILDRLKKSVVAPPPAESDDDMEQVLEAMNDNLDIAAGPSDEDNIKTDEDGDEGDAEGNAEGDDEDDAEGDEDDNE